MQRLRSKRTIIFIAIIVIAVVTLIFYSNKDRGDNTPITTQTTGSRGTSIFTREEPKDPLSGLNNGAYMPVTPPASNIAVGTKIRALPNLPIYIQGFQTSTGISVDINIYTLPTDPEDVLRFDIRRLNYINQDSNPSTNPHVGAFKEAFLKGKEELQKIGVNMGDVYFIFGTKDYIKETANLWVRELGLL